MTKTTKITTSIMLIAVLSLMTTSLSYQPQEAFATVTNGDSITGFEIIDPVPIGLEVGEDNQQDSTVFAFDEQIDIELTEDTVLDLAAPMVINPIPQGTIVSSTTVVFDPPGTSLTYTQGCVEFEGQDVLGIQFTTDTLTASDDLLGHPNVIYGDPSLRGIEPPPHGNNDQVYFVGPLICFALKASTPGDTFRVITTSEHVSTLLWQIGTFDNSPNELSGAGGLIKDNSVPPVVLYDVDGVDPKYPKALGDGGSGLTTQVDISFESESCQDAMLIYSRAGVENDEIYLDGILKGTVMSAEGVYDTSSTELGPLSAGTHVLTIKYIIDSNGTPDDWHNNDALALTCWEDAVLPKEIIEIDVKPGSDPSSWSCKNTKSSMPVAVFGSETFKVETIDIDSLIFTYDETSTSVTEVHGIIHIEDKNGDEYSDAVLHLDSAGVCEATDDAPLKETVDVTLSGTFGEEQSFEGLGDIRIVNNGNSHDNGNGKDNNNGKGKGKP